MKVRDRVKKAIDILDYSIKNNLSLAKSCKIFGVSDTYVKNVKSDIVANFEINSSSNDEYDLIMRKYNEFSQVRGLNTQEKVEYEKRTDLLEKEKINKTVNEDATEMSLNYEAPADIFNKLFIQSPDHIYTLEQLLDKCKVDQNEWKVKNYIINKWDVTAVINDTLVTKENFQVKATLERNKTEYEKKQWAEFLKTIKSYAPDYSEFDKFKTTGKEKYLLELSLPDLHVGKLSWDEESGENYDTKIAIKRYNDAVTSLLNHVSHYKEQIHEILLPVGNDLFNIDNKNNMTTAGTPQHVDSRWQQMFRKTKDLMLMTIDKLSTIAPVKVVMVSGNHDCYSMDTEVLTNKGFKFKNELCIDDLIATVNPHSIEIEYQPYTNLFEREHVGEIYHIKNRYTDLMVTENHRMFFREKHDDQYRFEKICDVSFKTPKYFRISANNYKDDNPNISDDELRLLGWINSDGSIKQKKSNHRKIYHIYQVEGKHNLVKNLLDNMNIRYYEGTRYREINDIMTVELKKKKNTQYTYTLNVKNSGGELMDRLDSLIEEKYSVPKILFECSKRQVEIYLNAFIDGDGTRKKGNDEWATIYGVKKMLNSLQELTVANGIYSKLLSYRDKNWRLYIQLNKNNTLIEDKCVNKIPYNGNVWCLTVPNSNFITRRNGTINIQGNCQTVFYLGEVLQAWYNTNSRVTVDNSASLRKYYRYGTNLIGFTHGDQEKHLDLPYLMSEERKADWAETSYREFHLGHFHKRKTISFVDVDENRGIKVRVLPSLSGTDAWHHSKGYRSMKSAVAFLYDKNNGLVAEFNHNVI